MAANDSVIVAQRDGKVVLHYPRFDVGIELGWQKADELARTMRLMAAKRISPDVQVDANIRVRVEEVMVLEWQGHVFLTCVVEHAVAIANAITVQARRVEEIEKADDIAADFALLFRAGFPLGLSNDPVIQGMAARDAAWGKASRAAMPVAGIQSREMFGTPTIIQHLPKEKNDGNTAA